MTITTRSKRVSIFEAAVPTTSTVGPGAYAPEKVSTSFRIESRPSYSGFAASGDRNLNANTTTSAITPGPGSYLRYDPTLPVSAPSNSFTTKVARFAPSAPGSSVYQASTVQDNPGPGSYQIRSCVNNQSQSAELGHRAKKEFPKYVRASVPTIPKKSQSFGYVPNEIGELRAQAPPSSMYSGIGQDTVGPAAYNAHGPIVDSRKNVAPSLQSTVKRDVWQDEASRSNVPGPGQYDDRKERSIRRNDRPSAVFASKVPLLPDPKRPDQYDQERDFEIMAKELRIRDKIVPRGSKNTSFGSTTGRTDVSQQISAPFSSPSFLASPGPGQYTRGVNRPVNRKPKIRHDDSIGFTSMTERACLMKDKPSAVPGPGAYISETPRTVEKTVQGKQTIGRFGVFGSTSERNVWEGLASGEGEERTPGPGAYEMVSSQPQGGHDPLASHSAAFKSNTSRFVKPSATPHVYCVGEVNTPSVGQYDVSLMAGIGAVIQPTPEEAVPSPAVVSPRAPFLSTAERHVFDPRDQVPGPGEYQHTNIDSHVLTRTQAVRLTVGNEERFKFRPSVPATVGPGSYSLPGTVGTKSFNITMKGKDKNNEKK